MPDWMSYVILILGFLSLTKGADFFVEGAAATAQKLKIPSFIIGMTIVAMGTSAPECAVSVTAALKGNNQLAVSNAVGSNIFNLMVVCGACALVVPLAVGTDILKTGISVFHSGRSSAGGHRGIPHGTRSLGRHTAADCFRRISILDGAQRLKRPSPADRRAVRFRWQHEKPSPIWRSEM